MIHEIYIVTPDRQIYNKCLGLHLPCLYDSKQGNPAAQKLAFEAYKLDGDIYLNIQGDEPLLEQKALSQMINEMLKNKKNLQ